MYHLPIKNLPKPRETTSILKTNVTLYKSLHTRVMNLKDSGGFVSFYVRAEIFCFPPP